MIDFSLSDAALLSLVGLATVFFVLVFLMVVIYIQTAIFKNRGAKPAAAKGAVSAPAPAQAPPATTADVKPEYEAKSAGIRQYKVAVNGVEYDVEAEMEELVPKAAQAAPAAPAQPKPQAPAPAKPAAAPAKPSAGDETVLSPLPGVVLSVDVAPGDTVKQGQTLLVLEAMKMENEVTSPRDGKVVSVAVAKGATVNSGDTLVIIG